MKEIPKFPPGKEDDQRGVKRDSVERREMQKAYLDDLITSQGYTAEALYTASDPQVRHLLLKMWQKRVGDADLNLEDLNKALEAIINQNNLD